MKLKLKIVAFLVVMVLFLVIGFLLVNQPIEAKTNDHISNEPIGPMLVDVVVPETDKRIATAYLTVDNYLITVGHVARYNLWYANGDFHLANKNFECDWWSDNVEEDGICQSWLLDTDAKQLQKRGATPISRESALDYDVKEVAVWSYHFNTWLFFEIEHKWESFYTAIGLPFDSDTDGIVDSFSRLCPGYSGSPVFLSIDGQPQYNQNGALIAIGETAAIFEYYPEYWEEEDLLCDIGIVINVTNFR